jgi:hypothetical protein
MFGNQLQGAGKVFLDKNIPLFELRSVWLGKDAEKFFSSLLKSLI